MGALCGLLAMSACGDDSEAGSVPTFTVAVSSYTSRPPATTTTTIDPGKLKPGDVVPQEQEYTVQSGDYLAGIAQQYGISADEIANYNNFADGVGEVITPGQTITIPPNAKLPDTEAGPGGGSDETATTDELAGSDQVETSDGGSQGDDDEPSTGDNCGKGSYTVEEGDYPIGVAQKFDVTPQALDQANAGTAGYSAFYPGLEIVIPAKSDC